MRNLWTYCMLYRAQKRMDGEDVFGRKITVGYPHKVLERDKKEGSPMKAQSGKKYYILCVRESIQTGPQSK